MLCSSPMSAKMFSKTGSSEPSSAGMCRPACAIRQSRPTVLSATVLPPVFGPVMTTMRTSRRLEPEVERARPCRSAAGGAPGADRSRSVVGDPGDAWRGSGWRSAPWPGASRSRPAARRPASDRARRAATSSESARRMRSTSALLGLQLAQAVVHLDDDQRLDEERRAADRLVVDDAAHLRSAPRRAPAARSARRAA